jgi:hypothetical protein
MVILVKMKERCECVGKKKEGGQKEAFILPVRVKVSLGTGSKM